MSGTNIKMHERFDKWRIQDMLESKHTTNEEKENCPQILSKHKDRNTHLTRSSQPLIPEPRHR